MGDSEQSTLISHLDFTPTCEKCACNPANLVAHFEDGGVVVSRLACLECVDMLKQHGRLMGIGARL